jgi:hypothetical protein
LVTQLSRFSTALPSLGMIKSLLSGIRFMPWMRHDVCETLMRRHQPSPLPTHDYTWNIQQPCCSTTECMHSKASAPNYSNHVCTAELWTTLFIWSKLFGMYASNLALYNTNSNK